MTYGIELNTTDGIKSDLNFRAGRLIGRLIGTAEDIYPLDVPVGVDLTKDVVISLMIGQSQWGTISFWSPDPVNNQIKLRSARSGSFAYAGYVSFDFAFFRI